MKAINRIGYMLLFLLVGSMIPIGIMLAGGTALWQSRQRSKTIKQSVFMTCSIDANCPPGFACIGGQCVPVEE